MTEEEMQAMGQPEAAPRRRRRTDGHEAETVMDPHMSMGGGAVNWLVIGGFIVLVVGSTHRRGRDQAPPGAPHGLRRARRRGSLGCLSAAPRCPGAPSRCPRADIEESRAGTRGRRRDARRPPALRPRAEPAAHRLDRPHVPQPPVSRRLPARRAHRLRRGDAGDAVRPDRGRGQLRLDHRLDPLVAAAAALLLPLLALLVHGLPVPGGRRVVPAPHRREPQGAAPAQEVRHLDHRPDLPVHHVGRPRLRHRRVAARHRLPAAGHARRGHRHEPVLRAPRLLQPPLLPRRALGQLLDDLARSPSAPTRTTARRSAARTSGAPTARSARRPARSTRRRGRWTRTATATCAATA